MHLRGSFQLYVAASKSLTQNFLNMSGAILGARFVALRPYDTIMVVFKSDYVKFIDGSFFSPVFYTKNEPYFNPMQEYLYFKAETLGYEQLSKRIRSVQKHEELNELNKLLPVKDKRWPDAKIFMDMACKNFVCKNVHCTEFLKNSGTRRMAYVEERFYEPYWGVTLQTEENTTDTTSYRYVGGFGFYMYNCTT